MGSLVNSTKFLRKKIIPVLYNLFQKTEAEEIIPNSLYEDSNTISKQTKTLEERKHRIISLMK